MSFENPTALQLGMTGELAGKTFRVLGRVVMSMTDDGVTYYWNEFNLATDAGESATLVFEETERGGEWRLFTMFEPEYPMTAEDAATKRVGDPLNLDGTDVVVTFVDRSRVQFIQGQGPAGLKVRDVAKYFNAEAGAVMQVVSWTGEEMEYYNGVTLSAQTVSAAFNLPRTSAAARFAGAGAAAWTEDGPGEGSYFSDWGVKALIGGLAVVLIFMGYACIPRYHVAALQKIFADKPPLVVGADGALDGKKYHVAAHAVVEIAEVGIIFQRHEYQLTDEYGRPALLVCGMSPGAKDWTLFNQLYPLLPLTPQQAGSKKIGDVVNIDGVVVTVGELFRSTISAVENENSSGWKTGAVTYGFSGKSDYQSLLARWDDRGGIIFYRGKNISAKVIAANLFIRQGK